MQLKEFKIEGGPTQDAKPGFWVTTTIIVPSIQEALTLLHNLAVGAVPAQAQPAPQQTQLFPGDEPATPAAPSELAAAVEQLPQQGRRRRGRGQPEQAAPVTETVIPPRADAVSEQVAEAKQELEAPAPKPEPAKEVEAPKPEPAKPAVAAEQCPPELAAAVGFRQVMTWMLANGHKDKASILAKCEAFRASCPALSRLDWSTIGERVERALTVITETSPAA